MHQIFRAGSKKGGNLRVKEALFTKSRGEFWILKVNLQVMNE